MSALAASALRRALADAAIYRQAMLASLDQLHEAQQTIQRQREQIAEMREERERLARTVFTHEA